ncbi:hypothetical protein KKI93_17055 [Xenorhabdus bovienii]|uniref:hypothetical protein n=1 Tax=Xenorhabdus bovienii TaxID=40576 RepID=UPI00237CE72D|nr:hypothetical protein [Xenorhabdus bovienii]MDE1476511.1 hypothetical protein [Xenorhabdus bovienii]MDE9565726.1 hypothetical protein [Xenorhabdus bovienii]
MKTKFISLICLMLMSGCVGITSKDIRSVRHEVFFSDKSPDDFKYCLIDNLDHLRGDRMLIEPVLNSKSVEILIGALQLSNMRYYHRVIISDNGGKTRVSIQSLDDYYRPLTKNELREMAKNCL